MIQLRCQVVKAVFFAVCSECGAEGPEELSTQEAHEAVIGLRLGLPYDLSRRPYDASLYVQRLPGENACLRQPANLCNAD